jgi:hypothetical protein
MLWIEKRKRWIVSRELKKLKTKKENRLHGKIEKDRRQKDKNALA